MANLKLYTFLASLFLPTVAVADSVIAIRTIRSQSILSESDVMVEKNNQNGSVTRLADVIGLETKYVLYEGRPISASDIGPAATITRNQIVTLVYLQGGLSIAVEARSLGRAGIGEWLRVMNLSSRNTIRGLVAKDGNVLVGDLSKFEKK